ncbi:RhoGAP domain protein [Trichinella nativa]|uniref:RhoGAP domain protein n=1 Tax=Trichinella nativa TaxID=6335 RepID=A0A1Y3E6J9_9BILA|nr:RhoGAP domain protein [Trichinella nativa]
MENLRKHMYRVQQLAQQTVGMAEKSEVRSEDLLNVEQRVETMKKVDEYNLALTLFQESKHLNTLCSSGDSLLSSVMSLYASSLFLIVDDMVRLDMDIEKQVFENLMPFLEAQKSVIHIKEKLKRLVLDMDAAKTRLAAAQSRGEKIEQIQDELANAQIRVENCKDSLATEVFNIASKEIDMANLFSTMEFFETTHRSLESCLSVVNDRIAKHPRRPVFGCPLDEHLRHNGREIALVLEVCCSVLNEIGLNAEGLFRISGNALKIRRLKASFDAGEIELSEFEHDPHSIAGVLKQYLRELPDPLLCTAYYGDWMKAVGKENLVDRLESVKRVLESLPEANYNNIYYLMTFLSRVAQNQHVTKIYVPDSQVGVLVECLISNASYFFPNEIQFTSSLIAPLYGCRSSGYDTDSLERNSVESLISNSKESNEMMHVVHHKGNCTSTQDSKRCSDISSVASKPMSQQRKAKQPAPPPPAGELAVETAEMGREFFNVSIFNDHEQTTSQKKAPLTINLPVPKQRNSTKRFSEPKMNAADIARTDQPPAHQQDDLKLHPKNSPKSRKDLLTPGMDVDESSTANTVHRSNSSLPARPPLPRVGALQGRFLGTLKCPSANVVVKPLSKLTLRCEDEEAGEKQTATNQHSTEQQKKTKNVWKVKLAEQEELDMIDSDGETVSPCVVGSKPPPPLPQKPKTFDSNSTTKL